MSTVLANTITAVGGGGSTVKVNNDATFISEGGAITNTVIVQGLAKQWVQFDGSASGAAAIDSFNSDSMTDGGTGDYTITITNNMNNAGYSVPCAGDDRNHNHAVHTIATGSYGFRSRKGVEGTTADNADSAEVSCTAHGDLA